MVGLKKKTAQVYYSEFHASGNLRCTYSSYTFLLSH